MTIVRRVDQIANKESLSRLGPFALLALAGSLLLLILSLLLGVIFFSTSVWAEPPPSITEITSDNENATYSQRCIGTCPQNRYWNRGAGYEGTIDIKVVSDEAVTVSGTPTLSLSSGETAAYESGSGTTTLIFSYTIGENIAASDLNVTALNLPSGATILSGDMVNLSLVLPDNANLADNKDINIDSKPPAGDFIISWCKNVNNDVCKSGGAPGENADGSGPTVWHRYKYYGARGSGSNGSSTVYFSQVRKPNLGDIGSTCDYGDFRGFSSNATLGASERLGRVIDQSIYDHSDDPSRVREICTTLVDQYGNAIFSPVTVVRGLDSTDPKITVISYASTHAKNSQAAATATDDHAGLARFWVAHIDEADECDWDAFSDLSSSERIYTPGQAITIFVGEWACFRAEDGVGGSSFVGSNKAYAKSVEGLLPRLEIDGLAIDHSTKVLTASDNYADISSLTYPDTSLSYAIRDDDTCDGSISAGDFTAYTEGADLTVDAASEGKYYCLRSVDNRDSTNTGYQTIVVDFTPPTISLTVNADDANKITATATDAIDQSLDFDYQFVTDRDTVACNAQTWPGSFRSYDGRELTLPSGRRVCFRATDASGNDAYRLSASGGTPSSITNITSEADDETYSQRCVGHCDNDSRRSPLKAESGYDGTIDITVTFNRDVDVVGTPRLELSQNETARYASGSGSTDLIFTYTISEGLEITDLDVEALTLPDGAIIRTGTVNATLALPDNANLADNKDININSRAPSVSFHIVPDGEALNGSGPTVWHPSKKYGSKITALDSRLWFLNRIRTTRTGFGSSCDPGDFGNFNRTDGLEGSNSLTEFVFLDVSQSRYNRGWRVICSVVYDDYGNFTASVPMHIRGIDSVSPATTITNHDTGEYKSQASLTATDGGSGLGTISATTVNVTDTTCTQDLFDGYDMLPGRDISDLDYTQGQRLTVLSGKKICWRVPDKTSEPNVSYVLSEEGTLAPLTVTTTNENSSTRQITPMDNYGDSDPATTISWVLRDDSTCDDSVSGFGDNHPEGQPVTLMTDASNKYICFRAVDSRDPTNVGYSPLGHRPNFIFVSAGSDPGTNFKAVDNSGGDRTWHYVFIGHSATCGMATDFDSATSYTEGNDISYTTTGTPNNNNQKVCLRATESGDSIYGDSPVIGAPSISRITSPERDGTYSEVCFQGCPLYKLPSEPESGHDGMIDIEVVFDEVVMVSGRPQLSLNTGQTVTWKRIEGGSGTTTLTFEYDIAPDALTTDLDVVGINLPPGASITSSASVAAILTLPDGSNLADNKNIAIDSQAPMIDYRVGYCRDDVTLTGCSDPSLEQIESWDGSELPDDSEPTTWYRKKFYFGQWAPGNPNSTVFMASQSSGSGFSNCLTNLRGKTLNGDTVETVGIDDHYGLPIHADSFNKPRGESGRVRAVCFLAYDRHGNASYSPRLVPRGLDNTAPTLTVTNHTTGEKVSQATAVASDDDSGLASFWATKIDASASCDAAVFANLDPKPTYGSNEEIDEDSTDINTDPAENVAISVFVGEKVCFGATDGLSSNPNQAFVASAEGTIERLKLTAAHGTSEDTGLPIFSVRDNYPSNSELATTFGYIIRTDGVCDETVSGDFGPAYQEGTVIRPDASNANKYFCFRVTADRNPDNVDHLLVSLDFDPPVIVIAQDLNNPNQLSATATDNFGGSPTLESQIITTEDCETLTSGFTSYTAGTNLTLTTGQKACFRAIDTTGNQAYAVSGIGGTPATITEISSPETDQTYSQICAGGCDSSDRLSSDGFDGELDIEITFSESMDVSGVPTIDLSSGETAYYKSGSGTATLVFGYQIGTNILTDDLNVFLISLPNGATIRSNGVNASLTLPTDNNLADNKDIDIDSTPPSVRYLMSACLNDRCTLVSNIGNENFDGSGPTRWYRAKGYGIQRKSDNTDSTVRGSIIRSSDVNGYGTECTVDDFGRRGSGFDVPRSGSAGINIDNDQYHETDGPRVLCGVAYDNYGNATFSNEPIVVRGIDDTAPTLQLVNLPEDSPQRSQSFATAIDGESGISSFWMAKIPVDDTCEWAVFSPLNPKPSYKAGTIVTVFEGEKLCWRAQNGLVHDAHKVYGESAEGLLPPIELTLTTNPSAKLLIANDNYDVETDLSWFDSATEPACDGRASEESSFSSATTDPLQITLSDEDIAAATWYCVRTVDGRDDTNFDYKLTFADITPPSVSITYVKGSELVVVHYNDRPNPLPDFFWAETEAACDDTFTDFDPGNTPDSNEEGLVGVYLDEGERVCAKAIDSSGNATYASLRGVPVIEIERPSPLELRADDLTDQGATWQMAFVDSDAKCDRNQTGVTWIDYTENQGITLDRIDHQGKWACFRATSPATGLTDVGTQYNSLQLFFEPQITLTYSPPSGAPAIVDNGTRLSGVGSIAANSTDTNLTGWSWRIVSDDASGSGRDDCGADLIGNSLTSDSFKTYVAGQAIDLTDIDNYRRVYDGNAYLCFAARNSGTDSEQNTTWMASQAFTPSRPGAPTVASVDSPAASYEAGDTIRFTIAIDRLVSVDTNGGTPCLQLTISSESCAGYVDSSDSSAGFSELLFDYTVVDGDVGDPVQYDGVGALKLNGGTIVRNDPDDATDDTALNPLLPEPGSPGSLPDHVFIDANNLEITVSDLSGNQVSASLDHDATVEPSFEYLLTNSEDCPPADPSFLHYVSDAKLALSVDQRACFRATPVAGRTVYAKSDAYQGGLRISQITSPKDNGYYKLGTTIVIEVHMSEPVVVRQTLSDLALNSGGTATYRGLKDGRILEFVYRIKHGDNSTKSGININYLEVSSIPDSFATSIYSLDGQPLEGGLPSGEGLNDNKELVIDTSPPTIRHSLGPSPHYHLTATTADNLSDVRSFLFKEGICDSDINWRPGHSGNPAGIGNVGYCIRVSDQAGHTTLVQSPALSDTTAPTITVSPVVDGQLWATVSDDIDHVADITFQYKLLAANQLCSSVEIVARLTYAAGSTLEPGANNRACFWATDTSGNAASANSEAVSSDATAPTIVQIYSDNDDGVYKTGEELVIKVEFSLPIHANLTPSLILDSGASADFTAVVDDSNGVANTATFTYTVADGDSSPDLNVSGFDMDGGWIRRLDSQLLDDAYNVDVGIPVGENLADNQAFLIDTTPPVIHVSDIYADKVRATVAEANLASFQVKIIAGDGACDNTVTSGLEDYVSSFQLLVPLGKRACFKAVDVADQAAYATSGIGADTTAPTITSITTSSESGFYAVGSTIKITVGFSESVTATGDFKLILSNDHQSATCDPCSGQSLSFIYTVAADGDTSDLNVAGFVTNNVTVEDAGSNAANLGLPFGQNLADSKDIGIDTVIPTITSITSTTDDGLYGLGSMINITVNFSEPVIATAVAPTSTSFKLILSNGHLSATCAAPCRGQQLSFVYEVAADGDTDDLNLDAFQRINIKVEDAGGNTANLSIPAGQNLADSKDIMIDATSPVINVTDVSEGAVSATLTEANPDTFESQLITDSVCESQTTGFSTYTAGSELTLTLGQKACFKAVDLAGNTSYATSSAAADDIPPIIAVEILASGDVRATVTDDVTPVADITFEFVVVFGSCNDRWTFASYTANTVVSLTAGSGDSVCFRATDGNQNTRYTASEVDLTVRPYRRSNNFIVATANRDGATLSYAVLETDICNATDIGTTTFTDGTFLSIFRHSDHGKYICFKAVTTSPAATAYKAQRVEIDPLASVTLYGEHPSNDSYVEAISFNSSDTVTRWQYKLLASLVIDDPPPNLATDTSCEADSDGLTDYTPDSRIELPSYLYYQTGLRVCLIMHADGETFAYTAPVYWPYADHPVVLDVSTTSPSGTYDLGQTIRIEVLISRLVDYTDDDTGDPVRLKLNAGDDRYANWAGLELVLATPSNPLSFTKLFFDYEIQAGDDVDALAYSAADALALNGATIISYDDGSTQVFNPALPTPGGYASLSYDKDIAIRTVPVITVVEGTVDNSLKATGNEDGTTWYYAFIAGDATCDSGVTFPDDSNYNEGDNVLHTSSHDGQKLCFRSVDTDDNAGYGESAVLDITAPVVTVVVLFGDGRFFRATDTDHNTDSPTTWRYAIIDGDAACDSTVTFGRFIDQEGTQVGYFVADSGKKLCFRSTDGVGNHGYGESPVIEAIRPTITSISSTTADGIYGLGSTINVTVNLSEAVTVTGDLKLNLSNGHSSSVCSSTCDGQQLVFSYTVASGGDSDDLDVTGFDTTNVAILDALNNRANLAIPDDQNLADAKAIKIDATPPVITITFNNLSVSAALTEANPSSFQSQIVTTQACNNSLTTGFSDYTADSSLTLTVGQKACFKATDSADNTAYALSGVALEPPSITVGQGSVKNSFKAEDDKAAGITVWRRVFIDGDAACDNTVTFTYNSYPEGSNVVYNDTFNTRKVCFRSTVVANTLLVSYKASDVIDTDTTAPKISVAAGSATDTFKATDMDHDTNSPTTWHYAFIGKDVACDHPFDFTDITSYTEGNDVEYTDANNDQKLCFRSVDAANNTSYKASSVIEDMDTTFPTIYIVAGTTNTNSFVATDDETGGSTWHHAFIAGTDTCGSAVTFPVASNYDEGEEAAYTDTNNTQKLCFRSVDAATNTSYKASDVIDTDTTAPTILVAVGSATNTFKATDMDHDNNSPTAWSYSFTAGDAVCNMGVNFSDYDEGEDISYTDSHNGQRICFRSTDEDSNTAYATSDVIATDTTAPAIMVEVGATSVSASTETGANLDYIVIDSLPCGSSVDFTAATSYTDPIPIVFADHGGKYFCFRSYDDQANTGYAASTQIPSPAVVTSIEVTGSNTRPIYVGENIKIKIIFSKNITLTGDRNDFKLNFDNLETVEDAGGSGRAVATRIRDNYVEVSFISRAGDYTTGIDTDDTTDDELLKITGIVLSDGATLTDTDDVPAILTIADAINIDAVERYQRQVDARIPALTITNADNLDTVTASKVFSAVDDWSGNENQADNGPEPIFNPITGEDENHYIFEYYFVSATRIDNEDDPVSACASNQWRVSVADRFSYTEGEDITVTDEYNDHHICFRSRRQDVPYRGEGHGYGGAVSALIENIDSTAPIITVNTNGLIVTASLTEANPGTFESQIITHQACNSSLTSGFSSYTANTELSLAVGQKACFKATDSVDNTAYAVSGIVLDETPPLIEVIAGDRSNSFKATDQDEPGDSTWHYLFIAGSETCDGDLTFVTGYTEGDNVVYSAANNGQKVCFEATDTSSNSSYAASDVIEADGTGPEIEIEEGDAPNSFKATSPEADVSWRYNFIPGDANCNSGVNFTTPYTEGDDVPYNVSSDGRKVCFKATDTAHNPTYAASDVIEFDRDAPEIEITAGSAANSFKASDNEDSTWRYAFIDGEADCYHNVRFVNSYDENEDVGYSSANNGRKVCFRATDVSGNLGYMASAVIDLPVIPAAPTQLVVDPGDTELAVSWAAPDDDGGEEITSYIVGYRTDTSGAWTTQTHSDLTDLSLTLDNLINGTTYQIGVRATNGIGNGPWLTKNVQPVDGIDVFDSTPLVGTIALPDLPSRTLEVPELDFSYLVSQYGPSGIWSDGSIMYVVDSYGRRIVAYDLNNGFAWLEDKTLDTQLDASGNHSPGAIWSDGSSLYVTDSDWGWIFVYDLETKAYQPEKGINLRPNNSAYRLAPYGLWSDGTTLWVTDATSNLIYAVNLEAGSGEQSSDRFVDSAFDFENSTVDQALSWETTTRGLWSDGSTVWLSVPEVSKVLAFNLHTGARLADYDLTLDDANSNPHDIWSDGIHMWVVDRSGQAIYKYSLTTD